MPCSPLAECGRAACGIDEGYHKAEDNEEHKDACVAGDGGNEALVYHSVNSSDGIKARCEQRTDEEHYAALEQLAGELNIEAVIADPSAASFLECIRRHGRFRAVPAKNDVIDGIRRVSDALKERRILFSQSCTDCLREFSLYRWDNTAARDAPRKEYDHAMDDVRYFVSTVLAHEEDGFFALAMSR